MTNDAFDPVVLLLILGVSCLVGSWIVSMVDDWPAIRARRQVLKQRRFQESRRDSIEQDETPVHAANVAPIHGWSKSKIVVTRSDLHRGFGGRGGAA